MGKFWFGARINSPPFEEIISGIWEDAEERWGRYYGLRQRHQCKCAVSNVGIQNSVGHGAFLIEFKIFAFGND